MNFKKNKKGNVPIDTLMIIVLLFVVAVAIGVVSVMLTDIEAELTPLFNDSGHNSSALIMDNAQADFSNVWDGIFIFLVLGLWMAAIVLSFFIDTHPIFFVITIFILVFIIIIGVTLSVSYEQIVDTDDLTTIKTDFPWSYRVMTNMLPISIVMGLSIAVSLYAKNKFF